MFIITIIIWFILSMILANIAESKGQSGGGMFFLSFIFSPLIGLLILIAKGDNEQVLEQRKIASGVLRLCHICNEAIKAEAKKCKHCGSTRDAQPARERFDFSPQMNFQKEWDYVSGLFEIEVNAKTAPAAKKFVYSAYDALHEELPFGITIKSDWFGRLAVTGYWTEQDQSFPYFKHKRSFLIGYVPEWSHPGKSVKRGEGMLYRANINGNFTNIEIKMAFNSTEDPTTEQALNTSV